MKKTFRTDAAGHRERSGETVEVLRELTPQEADLEETGPMYRIRFADGVEADAFDDELTDAEVEVDVRWSRVEHYRKTFTFEAAEWEQADDQSKDDLITAAIKDLDSQQLGEAWEWDTDPDIDIMGETEAEG